MAHQAPEWYVTQYNNRVIQLYQNMGNKLRPTLTPAGRIEGEKAIFMRGGKGTARKKLRNTRAVPMNPDRKKFEVPLVTWEAFDTVEEYDLDRMTINEREQVAREGAIALGVATDQEIIDVIHAAVPTSGAQFVDGSSNDFSAAYAMLMVQRLQAQKVPWDGNVYAALPSIMWNQFLAHKVVNSADHVGSDIPFVKATDTRYWNGVNWFLLDDDMFKVPSSNKADIFMWHRSAVGWGNNTDLRSIWDWDNYESWWTVNMQSKGAAAVMQENGAGIIRGRFPTNGSITIA